MTTIFDFALALERIDACHIDIDMEIFRKFFVDWARSGFSKDGAIKLENMIKRIDQEIENNMLKELDLRLSIAAGFWSKDKTSIQKNRNSSEI